MSFHTILAEERNKPFVWGSVDCCLFCSNILKAWKNIDPAEADRGKYNTKISAYRHMLKTYGGYEQMLLQKGFIKIDKMFSKVGDVCLCENALGICDGRYFYFAGGGSRKPIQTTSVFRLI